MLPPGPPSGAEAPLKAEPRVLIGVWLADARGRRVQNEHVEDVHIEVQYIDDL